MADAPAQAWPAFALVAGLLLIGAVAARDGVFAAAGAAVARLPGPPVVLLASLLLVEPDHGGAEPRHRRRLHDAGTSARGATARCRLGGVPLRGGLMANSASLLLPGANLTNLIVLAHEHVSGATFAAPLAPARSVSVVLTIVFVSLGLDLGPNLAVSGALSAVLWLQVARRNGERPSVLRYTLFGLVLVPLTLSASLAVNAV